MGHNNTIIIYSLFLLAFVYVNQEVRADGEDKPSGPKRITLQPGPFDSRIRYSDQEIKINIGDTTEKGTRFLELYYDTDNEVDSRFCMMNLTLGEIIPIGNCLYSIKSADEGIAGPATKANIKLIRRNDLRDKYQYTFNVYTFPFNNDISFLKDIQLIGRIKNKEFIWSEFNQHLFHSEFLNNLENQTSKIQLSFDKKVNDQVKKMAEHEIYQQTLAEGDLIELGKKNYKIVKIVPPDPEKKIRGWFQISKDPITEEK